MINFSKRIVIFYKDLKWGRKKFDEYISLIPSECIKTVYRTANQYKCELKGGGFIKTFPAEEFCCGQRIDEAIVQSGTSYEYIDSVIRSAIQGNRIREVS